MEPKKPGYEERDVDVSALLRPALGLFALIVLSFFFMRWTLQFLGWRTDLRDVEPSKIARSTRGELPPEPRLQVSPPDELAKMRAEEAVILGTYDWVDRPAGIVRIPIERAMDRVLERGLAARGQR